MINIHKEILEAKTNNRAYFHPNFFSDVPTWYDFLNCIFQEVQVENPELGKNMLYGKDVDEKLVGNVIIVKNVYFSPQITDAPKYFKTINQLLNHFYDEYGIELGVSGPKVSVGPRHVAAHSDKWDGFYLQCQGTTIWTIAHKETGYKEKFHMKPGDFLFFPQQTTHELYCNEPRAGIIFNCPDVSIGLNSQKDTD